MKRFVFLTLFFYSCTLCTPANSRAAIPLGIVAAAAIGAALAPVAVTGFQQTKVSINTGGDYQFDAGVFTVPFVAYNNFVQAGATIALGYAGQAAVNLYDLYNLGLLQAYQSLNSLIQSIWPADAAPTPGTVFQCPQVSGGYSTSLKCTIVAQVSDNLWIGAWSDPSYAYQSMVHQNGWNQVGTWTGGYKYVLNDLATGVQYINSRYGYY